MKLAIRFLSYGALLVSLFVMFSCQVSPVAGADSGIVATARPIGGVIPTLTFDQPSYVSYDQNTGFYRILMNNAGAPTYSGKIYFAFPASYETTGGLRLRATGTLKRSSDSPPFTAAAATLKFNDQSVVITGGSAPTNFNLLFAYKPGTNSFIAEGEALRAEVNNLKFVVEYLPGTVQLPTSVTLASGSPSTNSIAYDSVAKTLSLTGTTGGGATAQLYFGSYEGTTGKQYKISGEFRQTASYGAGVSTANKSINANGTWTAFELSDFYQSGTCKLYLAGPVPASIQIRNLNVVFY